MAPQACQDDTQRALTPSSIASLSPTASSRPFDELSSKLEVIKKNEKKLQDLSLELEKVCAFVKARSAHAATFIGGRLCTQLDELKEPDSISEVLGSIDPGNAEVEWARVKKGILDRADFEVLKVLDAGRTDLLQALGQAEQYLSAWVINKVSLLDSLLPGYDGKGSNDGTLVRETREMTDRRKEQLGLQIIIFESLEKAYSKSRSDWSYIQKTMAADDKYNIENSIGALSLTFSRVSDRDALHRQDVDWTVDAIQPAYIMTLRSAQAGMDAHRERMFRMMFSITQMFEDAEHSLIMPSKDFEEGRRASGRSTIASGPNWKPYLGVPVSTVLSQITQGAKTAKDSAIAQNASVTVNLESEDSADNIQPDKHSATDPWAHMDDEIEHDQLALTPITTNGFRQSDTESSVADPEHIWQKDFVAGEGGQAIKAESPS
ncbi:hypothetical protein L207DRAFT_638567, partial [Hyaloscypha variabilis F]